MNQKKVTIGSLFIIAFVLLINVFNLYFSNMNRDLELIYFLKNNRSDEFQVFYKNNDKNAWKEKYSAKEKYNDLNNFQEMRFKIPKDSKYIRIDFGNFKGKLVVKNVHFKYISGDEVVNIDNPKLTNQMNLIKSGNEFEIKSLDNDPFLEIDIDNLMKDFLHREEFKLDFIKYILCLIGAIFIAVSFYYIKDTVNFIKTIFNNKSMILNLAKNDFKTKYVSSYLGIIWAFIHPLITIATFWFVFQIGFKSADIGNIPFIIWFICGIIPWFFFAEALSSATSSLLEYSYLVKKVVFKIEILPVVKIVSAFFIHVFFIVFIFIVYTIYGLDFSMYNLQVLYYSLCTSVLLLAVTILTSSIVLFFRDLNQIIGIILNVGFWFTPIGWSYKMIPKKWLIFFKLNPMYYIVEGYRDSLVYNICFIQRPYHTLYFWISTLIILFIGVKLFKKLKVHFADVI